MSDSDGKVAPKATNDSINNPILQPEPRPHGGDEFSLTDVQLANRNSGIHLETLKHEVTPIGMHYLLSHFDIPYVESAEQWSLQVAGNVDSPLELSLKALQQLPTVSRQVTLECAGNGRALVQPRSQSMPWAYEAVGNALWRGTSLCNVLGMVGARADTVEWVFSGTDEGVDGGNQHFFERSLSSEMAMNPDVMLAWEINGQPLPPQHGFPLRLVVPGWYGMASVKWLHKIQAIKHHFGGYQQVEVYRFRKNVGDTGVPVTELKVKSLMVPPGIPDWYTRRRLMHASTVTLQGRAWSGAGTPITRVEVGVDGNWHDAELLPSSEKYAWTGWRFDWHAEVGKHELSCRATDAKGGRQPLNAPWDQKGFGNNAVQKVELWVEEVLDEGIECGRY